jgi:hypothetical protein
MTDMVSAGPTQLIAADECANAGLSLVRKRLRLRLGDAGVDRSSRVMTSWPYGTQTSACGRSRSQDRGEPAAGDTWQRVRPGHPMGELEQFRNFTSSLVRQTGWRRNAARIGATAILLLIVACVVAGILAFG